jgi:3-oxoacyl-[acyl-carrier-protein] synthase III
VFLSRLAAWYPDEVLANADLARTVDTTDEWIVEHVGIRERRRSPRDMPVHVMGARAAELALEGFGDRGAIDLVVCAHSISDYHIPATANLIAGEVGCGDAAAFDLKAACSSFIFGLHAIRGLFATGEHGTALLVVPEAYTHVTDYTDRATCILWGDGAFACVVSRDRPPVEAGPALSVDDTFIGSRSKDALAVRIPAGGFFQQEGTVVQAFAIRKMADVIRTMFERGGIGPDEVSWLVGHQANLGILERAAARAGIAPAKNLTNIERYGNCGAAGAPGVLAQNARRFREGERVVVATVGSGLSWGGALMTVVKAGP